MHNLIYKLSEHKEVVRQLHYTAEDVEDKDKAESSLILTVSFGASHKQLLLCPLSGDHNLLASARNMTESETETL